MRFLNSRLLLACAAASAACCARAGAGDLPLALESSGEPAAAVFREVGGPFDPGRSMVFSAHLAMENPRPLAKPTATATRDINFRADLACIVIRQLDAAGGELAAEASLGVWEPGEKRLEIEAAPVPGVARVALECRLSGIAGRAVFSGFEFRREAAPLHLPEGVRILSETGSMPAVEIGGKPFPALAFHGQNLETSADASASARDLRLPYEHGLRLFSFNAWFDGVTKQNTLANLESLAGQFPDAHFLVRFWLGPRGAFFADFPAERAVFDDGGYTAPGVAGVHSEMFRSYMAAAVRRWALGLLKSPASRRIAGIIPMYWLTGEWQYADPGSPMGDGTMEFRMAGFDENHRRAFARWAVGRYGGIGGVNEAWGTVFRDESDIAVPTSSERREGAAGDFRDPATQRRAIDFSRFHSESVADVILSASGHCKAAFGGRVIVGPFYGYSLEHAWNRTGLQQQGHLGLGRVLDSAAIDFHGGPYSYNSDNRGFGKPVDTNAVLDSAALHGKLGFLEEDTYTHVAKSPGGFLAPGEHLKTKTLVETLAVLRRNLGAAIARGYLLYWMGLLEDGRFDLPEIWEAYDPVFRWLAAHPVRPAYRPQIALVIDENSLPLLAESSRAVTGRWLYELRSILARVDTTLGIYLQSDLGRIPDSVRMLVLATPYAIPESGREALRSRWMKGGRAIVFCHLPDAFGDSSRSERPGAISGMAVSAVDGPIQPASLVEAEGDLGEKAGTVFGEPRDRSAIFWRPKATLPPVNPHLVITDPEARVLARYRDDPGKRPSVAMRRMGDWTSVVTGVHSLAPSMWRWLAAGAGAHLYLEDLSRDFDRPDLIEASDDFLMVVSSREGRRTIRLPGDASELREIGGRGEVIRAQDGNIAADFEASVPRMFEIQRPAAGSR